jgi:hypothetical protein
VYIEDRDEVEMANCILREFKLMTVSEIEMKLR